MIFLNNISDSIKENHWDYFKSSRGYLNLLNLSKDTKIPGAERDYFIRLTNDSKLQSIIIGTPEQLRNEIEYYQTNFLKIYPLLEFHQTFLTYLNWEDIYPNINREAEKNNSKTHVVKSRVDLFSKLQALIKAVGLPIPKPKQKNIVTIKALYEMHTALNNFFDKNLYKFYSRIRSVFRYEDFIKENESWHAYKLTQQLAINVCPYCNRNYIHTSVSTNGKTRAELDHFYPKSKYPFLSISLYNLIPSCHVCNSNLKRTKDFYIDKHLHPYENNCLQDFHFQIKYVNDSIKNVIPNAEDFTIKLTPKTEDANLIKIINNSNTTFQITELHNFHKDIAIELLAKSVYYNKTKIEELTQIFGKQSGINAEFLKRFITGNYTEIGDFGKRPLAKYSYDILSKTDLAELLDL